MAYTVKQVAKMSGVSVRALHFYDEAGLLKPAYCGGNGYRFYEQPQLLMLQQILFYRELGFELKQIRRILTQPDFEKIAALRSHRKVLLANLGRTRQLIDTIDRTIEHLKGVKEMKSDQMFKGFSVAAGADRFDERIKLGGEPNDCKVSAKDTNGAMCVFEFTGGSGGPRHLHYEQDEWIYVISGGLEIHVGKRKLRLGPGESVFIPRQTSHAWIATKAQPCKIINIYEPAGKMEEFFREIARPFPDLPTAKQMANKTYTRAQVKSLHQLFDAHGMDITGPPLGFDDSATGTGTAPGAPSPISKGKA